MKNKSLAEYIVEIEAIMQSVSREVREALDEVSSGMKDVNNLLEDND